MSLPSLNALHLAAPLGAWPMSATSSKFKWIVEVVAPNDPNIDQSELDQTRGMSTFVKSPVLRTPTSMEFSWLPRSAAVGGANPTWVGEFHAEVPGQQKKLLLKASVHLPDDLLWNGQLIMALKYNFYNKIEVGKNIDGSSITASELASLHQEIVARQKRNVYYLLEACRALNIAVPLEERALVRLSQNDNWLSMMWILEGIPWDTVWTDGTVFRNAWAPRVAEVTTMEAAKEWIEENIDERD